MIYLIVVQLVCMCYLLKKLLKLKEIGEDEEKSFEKNIQTITDNHIIIVDDKVSSKEKEIMTI